MIKTKLIIFNDKYITHPHTNFKINNDIIKKVDNYCYLGIEIHKNGRFSYAKTELRKKAIRALYGLKHNLNRKHLSFRSLTTLFDSLVKPIVIHGAPIWTPSMGIINTLVNLSHSKQLINNSSIVRKLSNTDCEKVHLHFLKWSLGVNRKASNIGTWGECGRYPLSFECINITLKYYNRIKNLNDNSLVSLAFQEQQNMNLDWYKGIVPILNIDPCYSTDHVTSYKLQKMSFKDILLQPRTKEKLEIFVVHKGITKKLPDQKARPQMSKRFRSAFIAKEIKRQFRDLWFSNLNSSPKLEFYSQYKTNFAKEQYLDLLQNSKDRANLTKIRISAHHLAIETGRHKNKTREERICLWCKLSLGIDIVENEEHLLNECDLYATNRRITSQKLRELIRPTSCTHQYKNENIVILKTMPQCNTTTHQTQLNSCELHSDGNYKSSFFQIISRYIIICLKRCKKFLHPSSGVT